MKNAILFAISFFGLGYLHVGCNSAPANSNAVTPTQPPQIGEAPRVEPLISNSEQTIDEIIRATPPDLMRRQGCEPIDESDIKVSKNSLPVRIWVDGTGSFAPCGKIVSYQWDFGDGTKKNGRRTSHLYTKAGRYSVSLFLIDNNGNSTLIPSQHGIIVPAYYSISGRIADSEGNGIAGVTVQINSKPDKPLITDHNGNFKLSKADSGLDYIFTPMKSRYRFSPPQRSVTDLNKTADFLGEDQNAP